MLLANKAAQIVQSAITPNTVLFSVPCRLVPFCAVIYDAIASQIGALGDVRCVSECSGKLEENYLIQCSFVTGATDVKKTVHVGVKIKVLIFYGVLSNSNAKYSSNLVHIYFDLVRISEQFDNLINGIAHVMRFYGCKQKGYTKRFCPSLKEEVEEEVEALLSADNVEQSASQVFENEEL